ncbi:hypothetical protein CYLTODRAFT_458750 [Cylindrobasidium torrendii FP15055 ss-10]|uniref:Uncharacterized protein n=1 Tax=Cylindrobasidium torrendii FP15055 ss-10 TaxID=1314674 RepID=A0A0D7AWZ4_9AGAR|nr:hypothetical protein CYLTODRAFT_458750 [Cylindrobasidium torrendii FP15055 ss-10]
MPSFEAHRLSLVSVWNDQRPGETFPLKWEDLNSVKKIAKFWQDLKKIGTQTADAVAPPTDTTNSNNDALDKDDEYVEESSEESEYDPYDDSKTAPPKQTVRKSKGKPRKKTTGVAPQKKNEKKANKKPSRSSPNERTTASSTAESFSPSQTLVNTSHSSTSSSPEPANPVPNPPSRLGKRQRESSDDNDNDSTSPLHKVPKNVAVIIINKDRDLKQKGVGCYFAQLSEAYPLTSAANNGSFIIYKTPFDKEMRWECPLDEACKTAGQMSSKGLQDHCREKHSDGRCTQGHRIGSKKDLPSRLSFNLKSHIIQVHYGNDNFCCPCCTFKASDRLGSLVKHMLTCRKMKEEEKQLSLKKNEVNEESKTDSGEGDATDVEGSDRNAKNVVSKVDESKGTTVTERHDRKSKD